MQTAGERLRAKRKEANLSPSELGRRAAMVLSRGKPISESAVRNQENGTNGIPAPVAEAYAKVLKTTAGWLLYGDGDEVAIATAALREVPVLGTVQAGHWSTPQAFEDQGGAEEYLEVHLPQFDRARLFALRVVGRSMDLEYPEGMRIVVCPVQEIGVRAGDHVIVRRTRGGKVETTVKEVSIEGQQLVLSPRSTDPAYQTPIRIPINRDIADEGVEIVGVVVASYKVRPAQQGPLILS